MCKNLIESLETKPGMPSIPTAHCSVSFVASSFLTEAAVHVSLRCPWRDIALMD
jgi:hypothetical protein